MGGLAGFWIGQFECTHGTEPSHVANDGPATPPLARSAFKLASETVGAIAQVLSLDGFDDCEPCGTRYWIAGERPSESSRAGCVHDFAASCYCREREPASERLGSNQDVRLEANAFASKHGTRAGKPGLNFVSDQNDAMLVTSGAQFSKKLQRRNNEASLPKHWLDDDCRYALGSDEAPEVVFKRTRPALNFAPGISLSVRAAITVGVWNAIDVARKWLESGLIWVGLAGEGHSEQGSAMKC